MSLSLRAALEQHQQTMNTLLDLEAVINTAGDLIAATLKNGGTVFACGNGGSASDAQHFVAELTGRYEGDRAGYRAMSLTTDTSALTAIGNDYGFNRVFARQLESVGREGDLVLLISTSGGSPNILETCTQAKKQGIKTLALVGRDGGQLAKQADCAVVVPGQRTSRIQESHIFILHHWCERFEATSV